MRRLVVMRHAKSDWNSDAPDDHSRPLNDRGRHDAPRVGARLAALGWVPDRALSSDSKRTRQTWQLLSPELGRDVPVEFLPSFYHAGLSAVAAAVSALDDAIGTVLVLGHNPGWEDMVSRLLGSDVTLTTANAACLVVDANRWREAMQLEGVWRLEQLIRPREI